MFPTLFRVFSFLRLVLWKLKSLLRAMGDALKLPWVPFFSFCHKAVFKVLWCSIVYLSSIWAKSSFLNWAVGVIILIWFYILSKFTTFFAAGSIFDSLLGVLLLSSSILVARTALTKRIPLLLISSTSCGCFCSDSFLGVTVDWPLLSLSNFAGLYFGTLNALVNYCTCRLVFSFLASLSST